MNNIDREVIMDCVDDAPLLGTKIKSTGGRSSYYDVHLDDECLARLKKYGCICVKDIMDHAFNGHKEFCSILDDLCFGYSLTCANTTNTSLEYDDEIHLTSEQKGRALSTGYIQIDDLILSMYGNDFDFGTILKSLKRAYEDLHGNGKVGSDVQYNLNKIKYSMNQIKKRMECDDAPHYDCFACTLYTIYSIESELV